LRRKPGLENLAEEVTENELLTIYRTSLSSASELPPSFRGRVAEPGIQESA